MPTENYRDDLLSSVHCSWRELLSCALDRMDPEFLSRLECDSRWLPGVDLCFRAFFRVPRNEVRVVWLGESPYTREESANGLSFYDGQVTNLFRTTGRSDRIGTLSTMQPSIRNILKAWFVAIERLTEDNTDQEYINCMNREGLICNLSELFCRGQTYGWLWLNATLSIWPRAHEPQLEPDDPNRMLTRQIDYWRLLIEAVLWDASCRGAKIVLLGKRAEKKFAHMANNLMIDTLIAPHPRKPAFIQDSDVRTFLQEWRCLIETEEHPPS